MCQGGFPRKYLDRATKEISEQPATQSYRDNDIMKQYLRNECPHLHPAGDVVRSAENRALREKRAPDFLTVFASSVQKVKVRCAREVARNQSQISRNLIPTFRRGGVSEETNVQTAIGSRGKVQTWENETELTNRKMGHALNQH